jgi:transposase-like protein
MKEKTVVEKKRNSPPEGAGGAKKARRYTPDEKLKAVRLRLEEGFSVQDVCSEMGMAVSCLHTWIRQYQQFGEAGFRSVPVSAGEVYCARGEVRAVPHLEGSRM